jgi:HlyD family secretion protein
MSTEQTGGKPEAEETASPEAPSGKVGYGTADAAPAKAGRKHPLRGKLKGKRVRRLVILAVVIVAAVVGLRVWKASVEKKNASQTTYTEEAVKTRTITQSLTSSGTLEPANSYTVTTLLEGEVLSADFEEGDTVDKDTVLYTIDSSDASSSVEKAQIQLNQAQRSYETTAEKSQVQAPVAGTVCDLQVKVGDEVTQGQTIATVRDSSTMTLKVPFAADDAAGFYVGQAAVVTLDGSFETLSGTVKTISGSNTVLTGNMIVRYVTIQVSNGGGLTNSQSATATVNGCGSSAAATLEYKAQGTATASASGTVSAVNAKEGSKVSKDQTIVTLSGKDLSNDLQSAQDNLRSAELSMQNTQDQLDNYTIKSPIAGTIIDKEYKAGDTVESGKTLCTIYDLSYLEMTMSIDELDISQVSVGQTVTITADAAEGKTYTGTITKVSVAGTTSNNATSYPVTVRIDDTDGLLPGMNVDAEIVLSEAKDVLSVSNAAVSRGNKVLVTKDSPSAANALSDETAPDGYVYVEVTTGVSDDDYIEITDGLQEGDTVAYAQASSSSSSNQQTGMMMGMGGAPSGGTMPSGGGGGGMPSGGGGGGPQG